MAKTVTHISSEALENAMHEALMNHIRNALREKILERIEPDLAAAINAAMETMKASVGAFYDAYKNEQMVKIIIERKDKP